MLSDLLYGACSITGLIMIVGGLWLISKRKIYVDRASNQPTEVAGFGVRFKTNVPGLAFFALGFIPLLYPVYKLPPSRYHLVETVSIRGKFYPTEGMSVVYASAAQDPVQHPGEDYMLEAPFVLDEDQHYKLLLIANGIVVQEKSITRKDGAKGEITVDFSTLPKITKPPFNPAQIDSPDKKYQ